MYDIYVWNDKSSIFQGQLSEVNLDNVSLPILFFPDFYDDPILFSSMGGTEKTGTKLFAEEDIAKLAVLKSNDTVAKK